MRTLPRSLWYLIHVTLAQVSAQESLSLNTLYSFSGASLSGDPTFSLPQAQQLTVSVAICSTGSISPAFFVNNNTVFTSTTGDFEIPLHSGFGNWTGATQQGGLLVVQNVGQTSFQVAASTGGMYSESTLNSIVIHAASSPCA